MRADEWGGEADKLGHTDAVFLGNAVKTLEECGWVAARAHNWGRAAATFLISRRRDGTPSLNASHLFRVLNYKKKKKKGSR